MDNAKAIQVLTRFVKFIEGVVLRSSRTVPASFLELVGACTLAVEAIGKQIPKPVKYLDRRTDDDPWWNMSKVYFNCPACGRRLRYRKNRKQDPYCPNCGQALRWEAKV